MSKDNTALDTITYDLISNIADRLYPTMPNIPGTSNVRTFQGWSQGDELVAWHGALDKETKEALDATWEILNEDHMAHDDPHDPAVLWVAYLQAARAALSTRYKRQESSESQPELL